MSLASSGKVETHLVKDIRTNFSSEANFGIIQGGLQNTFVVLPTQQQSISSVNFQITPPSSEIAVSREILVKFYFEVTITATAGTSGYVIDPGLYDAVRAFPIAQVTGNINCTINNASIAQNNYRLINAFSRYLNEEFAKESNLTLAPSALDYYQNYSDVWTYNLGIVNDPLQSVGQSISQVPPRGAFLLPNYTAPGFAGDLNIISNPDVGVGVSGSAVVQFAVVEPLWLSPFLNETDSEKAFIGVSVLNIQMNIQNSNLVWSHSDSANASTITNMVVSFYQNNEVLMNYITPSTITPIPKTLSYNYSNAIDYSVQDVIGRVPGAEWTMQSQNINLNSIPRRIYIFAREIDSNRTVTSTDTFARIDNISLNFNNQSGILSGANPEQLWQISREAGCRMSWDQWSKFSGSVMVLDIGKGLMLNDDKLAPSLTTNIQFQLSIRLKNLNPSKTITFALYTVFVSDGVMTITQNTAITQNAILSVTDIEEAKTNQHEQVTFSNKPTDIYGGGTSFFNKLGQHLKKAHEYIRKEKSISKSLGDLGLTPYAKVAQNFGYGLSGGAVVRKSHLRIKNY